MKSYCKLGNVTKTLAKFTKGRYDILKIADKYFTEVFASESNTKAVFKAFKENIVDLDFVFLHGIYKILPFYLKDNTLCTIFEGEEIKSKEVSKKEIEIALQNIQNPIFSYPFIMNK